MEEMTYNKLLEDGTLILEVDVNLANVNKILLSQKGTHWGELFYSDQSFKEKITECPMCLDCPDNCPLENEEKQ